MKRPELLTPSEIAERFKVSLPTARAYMRRMPHQEKPLRVTAEALDQWELSRTREAGETGPAPEKHIRHRKKQQPTGGGYQIPRRRPA